MSEKKVVKRKAKEKITENVKTPKKPKKVVKEKEPKVTTEDTQMTLGLDLAKGEDKTAIGGQIVDNETVEPVADKLIAKVEVDTKPIVEAINQFINLEVREAVVNIAGSTPPKDFAISICKFFEANPKSLLRVRAIGAGSSHQLTKATIEANKMLISRGQLLSRFDFWSNEIHMVDGEEKEKSVSNVRLAVVDVMPNSLAQVLSGKDVKFITSEDFFNKSKEGGK